MNLFFKTRFTSEEEAVCSLLFFIFERCAFLCRNSTRGVMSHVWVAVFACVCSAVLGYSLVKTIKASECVEMVCAIAVREQSQAKIKEKVHVEHKISQRAFFMMETTQNKRGSTFTFYIRSHLYNVNDLGWCVQWERRNMRRRRNGVRGAAVPMMRREVSHYCFFPAAAAA